MSLNTRFLSRVQFIELSPVFILIANAHSNWECESIFGSPRNHVFSFPHCMLSECSIILIQAIVNNRRDADCKLPALALLERCIISVKVGVQNVRYGSVFVFEPKLSDCVSEHEDTNPQHDHERDAGAGARPVLFLAVNVEPGLFAEYVELANEPDSCVIT